MNNFNNKMPLVCLSFLLLGPSVTWAKFWPSSQLRETARVFSPNRERSSFAHTLGLTSSLSVDHANTRDEYFMMHTDPNWGASASCEGLGREHGSIHTVSDEFSADTQVKIAVPIRFIFETPATREKKEQMLLKPFLKVKLLTVTHQYSLGTLIERQIPEVFRLKDFVSEEQADLGTRLSIHYDSILTGKGWKIPRGVNYRIRVEWFGEGLCGEEISSEVQNNPTVFEVGDQIRLLKVKSE